MKNKSNRSSIDEWTTSDVDPGNEWT